MDHAITDGLSWIAFATAFDEAHGAVSAGHLPEMPPLAVNPPVETLLALSGYPKPAPAPPLTKDAWRHDEQTPMQARKTRYLHMRLDEAEMHDLIARCHADRVTVTDAMMAAYAKAVAGSEPSPAPFVLAVPHNIRDSVKPPISSGDMGAFVVEIPVECDSAQCGDADFWTLAAALGHGLREALPAAMAADPDYDMEMLGQAVDGIVDPQRPAFANAVLSNLGVPAIGEGSDGLAVDRLYIGVSMHAGANAFFITAATIGGALDISLGACHSLILPAAHRAVSERFMQCLKTA